MTDLHVVPAGDLIAHDKTPICICGPTAFSGVVRGRPVVAFVHPALDGRPTPSDDASLIKVMDDLGRAFACLDAKNGARP